MPEAGESSETVAIDTKKVHASLDLKQVAFSGDHVIDQDTEGPFDPPHWASGHPTQWPVCYTRGKNVKLKATFVVIAPPEATETVKIKGVAKLGAATLEWTADLSVSPGDKGKELVTGELTSSAPLPNEVACYDPATIEWEGTPPGAGPFSVGASANVMYVTLGDPKGKAYWTLLDISCRAAHGATSAATLIPQAYAPFRSRNLKRLRDGKELKYWIPRTTNITDTVGLLSADHAGGQCGSWAHFLIDMYGVHGENARFVTVTVYPGDLDLFYSPNIADKARARGFLVKDWIFIGNGSLPAPFTHKMTVDCISFPIAGQGPNPSPPPAFYCHYIVQALGVFYDPSYGSPPFLTEMEWENASIDGLYQGFYPSPCGYPKTLYPNTRLTTFA